MRRRELSVGTSRFKFAGSRIIEIDSSSLKALRMGIFSMTRQARLTLSFKFLHEGQSSLCFMINNNVPFVGPGFVIYHV